MVARNWRCDLGEIDLVVAAPNLLVFVEVKARASDRFGPAAAAVGTSKQRRLRRLATSFMAVTGAHAAQLRFDVVAITGVHVEVIEAAF